MAKKPLLTPVLIAIVGFLTVCPVVMLLHRQLFPGARRLRQFTLTKYVEAYTDPALVGIIGNTVIFILGSAVAATALALFLAYLNTRTNIPFKFLFGIISIIPMMIPHILFAVSWVLLLNPSNGMLNRWVMDGLGLQSALFNIYSLPGMILVEGLLDLPIAYLIIAPAMGAFDVALEESSKVCGASNLRTLMRVTLPVLRPAILASAILVVVRSLASFAVPSVIGMPGRIYVLSTYIYRIISTGFAADYGKAAAVGMSALAASITLIYLYRYLTAESSSYVTIAGRGFKPALIELKAARYPLCAAVGLLSCVLIVLPVVVLFYTSLLPYVMVPERPGLFADELEELVRGARRIPSPCCLCRNSLAPRTGGRHPGGGPVDLRLLRHRQGTHPGGGGPRVAELSLLFLPGHRHRRRLHVVFRPHPPLRHHLGAADRLHRHLPPLRHPPPVERLRPDPRPPGGVLPGLRRGRPSTRCAASSSPCSSPASSRRGSSWRPCSCAS